MMNVTVCGHAGLFIETGQQRILVDPILRETPLASGELVHTFVRKLDLVKMPRLTGVVITHSHLDHFDPESLDKLSRDLPFIVPDDKYLHAELRRLNFNRLVVLLPWQSAAIGDLVLLATPSDTEVDEFGFVAQHDGASFWHMSDAEAGPDVALRIAAACGSVDLVSAKYKPSSRVHTQILRSLCACFDKSEVIRSLETACCCNPKMAFPYAAGMRFIGDHSWLNHHAFPFRADEITEILNTRLASHGRAVTVSPGDTFALTGGEGVSYLPQQASFIKHDPTGGRDPEWEPIDATTLAGVGRDERRELQRILRDFLRGAFMTWVSTQLGTNGMLRKFVEFEVKWQLIVHAGDGERFEYTIDFSEQTIGIDEKRGPHANFFVHIAGKALFRILRGEAGADLLYLCGDMRTYEKIVGVRAGRLWAPEIQGWDLFENLPEPLSMFIRYRHKWKM